MVAIGLVLFVVSGALALGVMLSNTDAVSASAFGVTLTDVTIGGFFLVGAITGLVFTLGLMMMAVGASRRRARKMQEKRAVKDVHSEKEQLEQENAQLRERLAEPSTADQSSEDSALAGDGRGARTAGRAGRRGLFGGN